MIKNRERAVNKKKNALEMLVMGVVTWRKQVFGFGLCTVAAVIGWERQGPVEL